MQNAPKKDQTKQNHMMPVMCEPQYRVADIKNRERWEKDFKSGFAPYEATQSTV